MGGGRRWCKAAAATSGCTAGERALRLLECSLRPLLMCLLPLVRLMLLLLSLSLLLTPRRPGGRCEMLTSYDKGSSPFRLPRGSGRRLAAPFSRLLLERHYLLDEAMQSEAGVRDNSGLELVFSRRKPKVEAALLGFIDLSLRIPPQTKRFVYKSVLDKKLLRSALKRDWGRGVKGGGRKEMPVLVRSCSELLLIPSCPCW